MDERAKGIRKEGPDERKDMRALSKLPELQALSEADKTFLNFFSAREPMLARRLAKIVHMGPEEQRKSLDDFRIEIGVRQKAIIEEFLSRARELTKHQKEFLRNNLSHTVFWELLLEAGLSELSIRAKPAGEESYYRSLIIQSMRHFIGEYEERQEFTISPDLDVAALTRFHNCVIPAAKRLAQAKHPYQAINMMAGESLLVELKEAAMKLSEKDTIRFLNRLYKDPEFASFKIGIYRLINYLYPPPAKR